MLSVTHSLLGRTDNRVENQVLTTGDLAGLNMGVIGVLLPRMDPNHNDANGLDRCQSRLVRSWSSLVGYIF